jgi:streptomycin 6-kinase
VPELPHPGLAWMLEDEAGRVWLARLPDLTAACVVRWGLTLGEPYSYAMASLAMPAITASGADVVLKIGLRPDRESEHEAEALRRWDGAGAVRLLDDDPERGALLLERAVPGAHLSTAGPDAALDVLAGLLPRLWVEADGPFTRLEDEAAWWVATVEDWLPTREVPPTSALLDAMRSAVEDLATTQPERVLLHQDLHGDNVVAAEREPWLAIDPKPLVGERAFALAPIVRSWELGHSREQVVRRLDTLSERLGVDRERARRWAIAQTVAWCDDERHRETATWLLEA